MRASVRAYYGIGPRCSLAACSLAACMAYAQSPHTLGRIEVEVEVEVEVDRGRSRDGLEFKSAGHAHKRAGILFVWMHTCAAYAWMQLGLHARQPGCDTSVNPSSSATPASNTTRTAGKDDVWTTFNMSFSTPIAVQARAMVIPRIAWAYKTCSAPTSSCASHSVLRIEEVAVDFKAAGHEVVEAIRVFPRV